MNDRNPYVEPCAQLIREVGSTINASVDYAAALCLPLTFDIQADILQPTAGSVSWVSIVFFLQYPAD